MQGELDRVLRLVLRKDISSIQGAGRTDSGVHARGQVVNFKTDGEIDLLRLKHSVSSLLKGELAILEADYVPDSFNALRSAISRQYSYHILNRPAPAVLDRGGVWHITSELDLERMQREALVLLGKHDFTSFRGSGCMSSSPVKEIFESEVSRDGYYIIYRVLGKGFLKQMVRNIVGTLVQLARGTLEASSIKEVLEARDRRVAGVTAPAHGLYLDFVRY